MYSSLFTPVSLGKMEIKNRIVMGPMGNLADPDGGFSDRQIAYYAARAKGGTGLIVSGSLAFNPALGLPYSGSLTDIKQVGRLQRLSEEIHRYGAKLALQFSPGLGRVSTAHPSVCEFVSASEVPAFHWPKTMCRAMTKEEIDRVIACGADIIMLPYFKTCDEVEGFISYVDGRARTMLLLETPEACAVLDRIISLNGIDFVHIGINDLSLGYGYKFMFHLLADGTVEKLCQKLSASHIPYGFGGIASLGRGMLPAERIIMEHYRLGSEMAILSRSFCDTSKVSDLSVLSAHFSKEVSRIREYEAYCIERCDLWEQNRSEVVRIVDAICSKI